MCLSCSYGGDMERNSIKTVSCLLFSLFSFHAFAEDEIKITVKTEEQNVLGLGYSVKGKHIGGLGHTYSGKGPTAQKYVFGYRKRLALNSDVFCGTHVLTKDSTITLVTDGGKCKSIISN